MGIKQERCNFYNEKFKELYRIQDDLYVFANVMRNKGMQQTDVEALPEVNEMISRIVDIDHDIRKRFAAEKRSLHIKDREYIEYRLSCTEDIGEDLSDLSIIYDQNIHSGSYGPWVPKDESE